MFSHVRAELGAAHGHDRPLQVLSGGGRPPQLLLDLGQRAHEPARRRARGRGRGRDDGRGGRGDRRGRGRAGPHGRHAAEAVGADADLQLRLVALALVVGRGRVREAGAPRVSARVDVDGRLVRRGRAQRQVHRRVGPRRHHPHPEGRRGLDVHGGHAPGRRRRPQRRPRGRAGGRARGRRAARHAAVHIQHSHLITRPVHSARRGRARGRRRRWPQPRGRSLRRCDGGLDRRWRCGPHLAGRPVEPPRLRTAGVVAAERLGAQALGVALAVARSGDDDVVGGGPRDGPLPWHRATHGARHWHPRGAGHEGRQGRRVRVHQEGTIKALERALAGLLVVRVPSMAFLSLVDR